MKIEASKCSQCEKAVVPPRSICPYCGPSAKAMDRIKLQNQGIVLSHTIHHMPPEGFESPLLLALVKLEYEAIVLCTGNTADANKIMIDQEVYLRIDESGKLHVTLNE